MASAQELVDEAWAAIASGQFRLAKLTAAEAIERARNTGDDSALVEANYWRACAAYKLGDYSNALQLIMDGEQADIPASSYRFFRRSLRFLILLHWRPLRADLERNLNELKELARSVSVPRQDISIRQGFLSEETGDLASALRDASRAYRESLTCDWGGTVTFACAVLSANTCISLGDFVAAQDWIAKVKVSGNADGSWKPSIAAAKARLRLRLARARGSDIAKLRKLLNTVEAASRSVDGADDMFMLHLARFRVTLLDPDNGDPESFWHPARAACRYRFNGLLNVHRRYRHNLKILDFRLAALRFSCGLAPIDDEFASPPSGPLSCAAHPDAARRLCRARAALNVAYRHARRIDTMLECNLREKTVNRSAAWIEAIAAALASPPCNAASVLPFCRDAR
jgi:hypothetical protein